MSAKFLLPCHDGQAVVVTTADAGRTIDCPCGKKVQVPTLRGVQALPRAEDPDVRVAAPTWSSQQGAIFTTGLCVLVVGLLALAMTYNQFRRIETTKPEINVAMLEQFKAGAENADPVELLEFWEKLKDNPLEERPLLQWEANREGARQYMMYMAFAAGVAAIGLAMAIAGPMMRPAPRKKSAAPAGH